MTIATASSPNAASKLKKDIETSLPLKNSIATRQLKIPTATAAVPTTITLARSITDFQFILSLAVKN